jgi:hypothetical protein
MYDTNTEPATYPSYYQWAERTGRTEIPVPEPKAPPKLNPLVRLFRRFLRGTHRTRSE